MKSKRTRALVLRRTNYGEADRIVQFLTPEGKVSAIAKGVRKENSRLAGGIELFAICEIVISKGKSDLDILTSARLIHFYNHILEDYERLQFAYTSIKIISSASENSDDPDWYDLLVEILSGLDLTSIKIELIQTWFYLRYALITGYGLSLHKDINGKKILPNLRYCYDLSERGLKENIKGELTSDHIKLLRLIVSKSIKTLVQIGGIDEVLTDCLITARQHASI